MFTELKENTSCSVSEELVKYVAKELYPEQLIDNCGNIKLKETLFMLGFRMKQGVEDKKQPFYKIRHARIRNPKMPSKTYVTTVYNGSLRNEVSKVENGWVRYTKQLHRLWPLYQMQEVLTVDNLSSILPTEAFKDISTIGSIEAYHGY